MFFFAFFLRSMLLTRTHSRCAPMLRLLLRGVLTANVFGLAPRKVPDV